MKTLKYGLSAAAAAEAAGNRIHFVQTVTVNHLYHREYIDFHRKTLKPLKIVLGNRTPCTREGISATLRASCVLIVCSVHRVGASCQVGILFIDSLKGQSGRPRTCQRVKAGLELGLFCWKTEGKSEVDSDARVSGSFPLIT